MLYCFWQVGWCKCVGKHSDCVVLCALTDSGAHGITAGCGPEQGRGGGVRPKNCIPHIAAVEKHAVSGADHLVIAQIKREHGENGYGNGIGGDASYVGRITSYN